jgi:hypothetical protein
VASESKLIWRGNPRCRSLAASSPTGVKFYLAGEEVPTGAISPALVDIMVTDGRIERIEATGLVFDLPPSADPPPRMIEVQVGIMEAQIDTGLDGEFGTADDIVTIRPLEMPETNMPEPVSTPEPEPVAPNPEADTKPNTAPTRARKGWSKRKK